MVMYEDELTEEYKDELTEAYEELYRNNPELKENHEKVCLSESGEECYFEMPYIITPLKKFTKEELFPNVKNVKHMMIFVLNKAGCFTQSEIAEAFSTKVTNVKKIIDRLSAKKNGF